MESRTNILAPYSCVRIETRPDCVLVFLVSPCTLLVCFFLPLASAYLASRGAPYSCVRIETLRQVRPPNPIQLAPYSCVRIETLRLVHRMNIHRLAPYSCVRIETVPASTKQYQKKPCTLLVCFFLPLASAYLASRGAPYSFLRLLQTKKLRQSFALRRSWFFIRFISARTFRTPVSSLCQALCYKAGPLPAGARSAAALRGTPSPISPLPV